MFLFWVTSIDFLYDNPHNLLSSTYMLLIPLVLIRLLVTMSQLRPLYSLLGMLKQLYNANPDSESLVLTFLFNFKTIKSLIISILTLSNRSLCFWAILCYYIFTAWMNSKRTLYKLVVSKISPFPFIYQLHRFRPKRNPVYESQLIHHDEWLQGRTPAVRIESCSLTYSLKGQMPKSKKKKDFLARRTM